MVSKAMDELCPIFGDTTTNTLRKLREDRQTYGARTVTLKFGIQKKKIGIENKTSTEKRNIVSHRGEACPVFGFSVL